MLDLAQLLSVPHVDNQLRFDICPDGSRVAFAWNKTGRWAVYEGHLSEADPPRRVSQGQGSMFAPKYSPDGSLLAFAMDPDGSEAYHIMLHDFEKEVTRDLTPDIAYAHNPNFSWSPDGKMLAVLSDKHGQFALHLLPLDGSPGRLLRNIFHPCWDVVWSPDGLWIAVESESSGSERSIHLVPVNRPRKGLKATTIQLKLGDQPLNAQNPAWSPDSKILAFSGENGEWHDIGLFEVETHEIRWIRESSGDDTQPAWSHNGDYVGWVHSEGAHTSFQFINGKSGPLKQVQVGPGVHYHPHFSGDAVLILYEDALHPCDLWKIDPGVAVRQLTNSLPDELRGSKFIQPEEVWYEGGDGAKVPALLYRPETAGRTSPALIHIHGGPDWAVQCSWEPSLSHLASRGWTVLAPNYRGSSGYGKKWRNASRYDLGGVDTRDCAAGVTYLIENGLADNNKIAVTGRSHGGYLTMTCLTGHPDLWAAGSAVMPFLNWLRSHQASREDLQHWNIENMGDPQDNREIWIAHSPYFFLERVNVPVQLICGALDPRCPASESLEARDKLLELGKTVDLLLYPQEGHTFLDTNNLIDSEVRRVDFLAKILEHPG